MKSLISGLMTVIILWAGSVQAVNVEKEKAKLLNTDREFAQMSVNRGAAEAFRMYSAENAMQMPARGEPIMGRDKIYQGMKEAGGIYVLDWVPQDGEVAKSGDMGWTWGKFTYYFLNDEGEMKMSYGKYVDVWKKQKDGTWKVVVDIGNSSPAPEAK